MDKREKDRLYSANYRKSHSAEVKASQRLGHLANPSAKNKQARAWQKANPEKVRDIKKAADAKRYARKRGNGGSWTTAEWLVLKRQFNNCCVGCGKSEKELKTLKCVLVPDHIVPIAKGGLNHITNLQPLCHGRGGCNLRKGVRFQDFVTS